MTGRNHQLLTVLLAICGPFACAQRLAAPPSGPHRAGAHNPAQIIQYPPPPVRVECVPPQPRDECVWVDGSWRRETRGWEWSSGAWVIPPPGCYHADAYAKWIRAGQADKDQLYYFEASWYPQSPAGQCKAPRVCQRALAMDEC